VSAPTTGDYANFVMVDKPGLTNPNQFILNGGNHMEMSGIIHMPTRNMIYNSGSRLTTTGIVVKKLTVNSGASLNIESANWMPAVPGETYAPVESGETTLNVELSPFILQ